MSTAGSIPGDLAERYTRSAEDEAQGRSPLYEALARGVAHDAEVVTFLSALPPAKQQPNLLFAAVCPLEGTSENFAHVKRRLLGNAEAVRSVMLARDIERRLLAAGWTSDLGAPRLTAWDDLPRAMADPAKPERMAWHVAISRHGGETVLFRLSRRHVRLPGLPDGAFLLNLRWDDEPLDQAARAVMYRLRLEDGVSRELWRPVDTAAYSARIRAMLPR